MNLDFEYNKKNKDGTTNYFSFDIKVEKTISDDYGYSGKLICNKCENKLKQKYICEECGNEHTMGDIQKRKDSKTGLIYTEAQKKNFLENERQTTVNVLEEIPLDMIYRRPQQLMTPYEIYTNDKKYKQVIVALHSYLQKNKLGLLCTFGINNQKSSKIAGVIIAGDDRLILQQLLDARLIKPPKIEGIAIPIENKQRTIVDKISHNKYPELIERFYELIEQNADIKVIEKEKPKHIEIEKQVEEMVKCFA